MQLAVSTTLLPSRETGQEAMKSILQSLWNTPGIIVELEQIIAILNWDGQFIKTPTAPVQPFSAV